MVTFQGGSAVLFTEPVRDGDRGEAAGAPRRYARAGLAAVRGLAKDLVGNRSLILRVFLPFVAGFALAYLQAPLADRLERLGMSRTLAALLIVTVVMVALIAVSLVMK